MRISVGTSGFSYPAWKGTFYPKELKADGFLAYYAERFQSVEINNTFYRMPKTEVLERWPAQVPTAFTFVLKAPQRITHMKRLKDVGADVDYFAIVARTLGAHLGPLLFQLHPNLKLDVPRLADFLATLPADIAAVLEFRHESWFCDATYDLLRAHGVALCVADTEEGLTPIVATAPRGYLRLRRPDYDQTALAEWRDKLLAQPWQAANVYFKHEDEARGPLFARQFRELLGQIEA